MRTLAEARSFLFVPGDRPERFAKALASGADRVVVDLEDAVAPERKAEARAALSRWLTPERPVLVRINADCTPDFADDLRLLDHPGVEAVVVPKAEKPDHLAFDKPLVPLIETAAGVAGMAVLASMPGVVRLAFGTVDFRLDMGVAEGSPLLDHVRADLAILSRAAGLAAPVDGVSLALADPDLVRSETRKAVEFGFGGKLCIHPAQVAHVHDAMRPSEDELAWATRLIGAAGEAQGSAFSFEGRMIDRPVLDIARRILARSDGA